MTQSSSPSNFSQLIYAVIGAILTLLCVFFIDASVWLTRTLRTPSAGLETSPTILFSAKSLTPTPFLLPTDTPAPTVTPMPTDTPTPIDTPTPTVTLSPSEIAGILSILATEEDKGVPEAKEYDQEKRGPHRIVLLTASGELSDFYKSLPDSWKPSTISEVELVAVLSFQQEIVASATYMSNCPGTRSSVVINRIRRNTFVVVKEAKTGKVVASQLFKGSDPPSFGWSVKCIKIKGFFGDPVPFSTIYQWLMGYVKP